MMKCESTKWQNVLYAFDNAYNENGLNALHCGENEN